jgi:hypothetical protein
MFLSVWAALHCSTRLLSPAYPGKRKTPQKSATAAHCLIPAFEPQRNEAPRKQPWITGIIPAGLARFAG